MSNELKNRCRDVLQARQTDLIQALRKRNGIAIEHSAEALEQTVWAAEREIAVGALDRDSRLLREVRAALQRIDSDRYGFCESCGQRIKPSRLDAVPWARRCVECQEAEDRAGRPVHFTESLLVA